MPWAADGRADRCTWLRTIRGPTHAEDEGRRYVDRWQENTDTTALQISLDRLYQQGLWDKYPATDGLMIRPTEWTRMSAAGT